LIDLTKCAAELTWDYLYGDEPRPWFLQHIRDRDLWLWENPNSKAFSTALHDIGFRFESLDNLLTADPQAIYDRGNMKLEYDEKIVRALCKAAELVEFEGFRVYALNTLVYISECGNSLCQDGAAQFAFVFRYKVENDEWWVSLRGTAENKIDLSAIAKKYGGGGHPLASGFTYRGDIKDILIACEGYERPRVDGKRS
jgi:oligoribonuclease NrnB/cAMP/cGMP phosphodiesterase (DHH superfamily)